jgi:hypothetical protein
VRARLLLAALLAALPLAGCGAEGGSGSAEQILERAARTPAKSADLALAFELNVDGVEELNEPVKLSLHGPYRSNGRGAPPDLDLRMSVDAASRNEELRLITVDQNAFVEYRGVTYEVGRDLVRRYTSRSRRQQGDLRTLGIDPSSWLDDAEVENGRKVSGEVDVRGVLEDVNRMVDKLPQGRRLPEDTIDQIEEAVEEASVAVEVGDDQILRTAAFEASFEVPDELRSKARGLEGGELELGLRQSNVNGDQKVEAPTDARPLSELLGGFGAPSTPG